MPLVQIEQAGRSTLTELRRLVGVLRRDDDEPELAPTPGLDRIEDLVDHVRQTGLAVDMTNTVKHARASTAGVCISYGDRELGIEVTDNGHGPGTATVEGGHGLVGMRERVALYEGQLT